MEIIQGLTTVLTSPMLMGWILAGAITGMVVGAIPGLTTAAAIAMVLPLTFFMEPLAALSFLYVIGKSGRYGGSIAAILFNTPGTAAAAATQIDGHQLALQGKASKAMKVATISSVIGDFIGDIILILAIGFIASIALRLGPPELFSIYFAAFILIGTVVGKSIIRGLASAFVGILVSMVGIDPISAKERLTFGLMELTGGVSLVPLMIGLFVLGEVLSQAEQCTSGSKNQDMPPNTRDNHLLTWSEYRSCVPHVLRSSLIGAVIGMLPGLGSSIAAFIAYGVGKQRAKNSDQWGKGALEGVAAPEAANNAVSGPSMAPLLTLGIPGSTIGAMLIGVFLIHGITIGPTLFITSSELVYTLFACGLVGIVFYGLLGYFGAAKVGQLIQKIPAGLMYPLILLTAFIAAYLFRGSLFDVVVMIVFGVVGWLMRKFDFSPAAFVISFVLAGGAEETFRQSLRLSEHGMLIFFTRPLALAFLVIGLFGLAYRIRGFFRDRSAS